MSITLRQYSRAHDITVTEAQQKLESLLEFRPLSECPVSDDEWRSVANDTVMNETMEIIDAY